MTQSNQPVMSQRLARVLHSALVGSVVVLTAMFAFVRSVVGVVLEGGPVDAIRYVGLGLLLVAGIVIFKLRARIPAYHPEQAPDAWWAANGQRVLLPWMVAEGTATVGGVFWFLTGDIVPLVVLGAAALLLVRLRPSEWTS